MEDFFVSHTLKFNIKPTSQGYLAQGVEIPSIIIEASDKSKLKKTIQDAVNCYFE